MQTAELPPDQGVPQGELRLPCVLRNATSQGHKSLMDWESQSANPAASWGPEEGVDV